MKRFVIGDIHGGYRALVQVLNKCKFDYENDQLICLGDVVDGWPDSKQCIDELMKIKNLVYIMGNHDQWCEEWLKYGVAQPIWTSQGGAATIESFIPDMPSGALVSGGRYIGDLHIDNKYLEFFDNAVRYYIIDDEKSPDTVFVHGGFSPRQRVDEQPYTDFEWDRNLVYTADRESSSGKNISLHKRVFVGHTAHHSGKPIKKCEVWNMDTGAGWSGHLSIMDIDTEEYWVSDKVSDLYPGIPGRR